AARRTDAATAYASVKKLDADEDRQCTMDVKLLAATLPPNDANGLRALLVGDPRLGPSWDEAAPVLGAKADAGDPLSQYLVGRNLWLHGRADAALQYLDAALDSDPVIPRG